MPNLTAIHFLHLLNFYWSIVNLHVLVSGVQQSESVVICKHLSTLF